MFRRRSPHVLPFFVEDPKASMYKNSNMRGLNIAPRDMRRFTRYPRAVAILPFRMHNGSLVVIPLALLVPATLVLPGSLPRWSPLPGRLHWAYLLVGANNYGGTTREGCVLLWNPKGREQERHGGRENGCFVILGPRPARKVHTPDGKGGKASRVGEIGWKRGNWPMSSDQREPLVFPADGGPHPSHPLLRGTSPSLLTAHLPANFERVTYVKPAGLESRV
ncbi:hypothetical protein VUR80DRAFT_2615 [Thermomyces stellatus]